MDGSKTSPLATGSTTVVIHLLVADPDAVAAQAFAAGAAVVSAVQDYDYGYRQGTLKDPFGHCWTVERTSQLPPLGVEKMFSH